MNSDPTLHKAFRQYNRLLFGNSLRDDVIIFWDALDEADAEIDDKLIPGRFAIRVNTALSGKRNQWLLALIHEMCHLHLWPYEKHGEPWDREIQRICKYRSFRKII